MSQTSRLQQQYYKLMSPYYIHQKVALIGRARHLPEFFGNFFAQNSQGLPI